MKIVIFSFYSGLIDRGVETWAENLRSKIREEFEIEIVGGKGGAVDWLSKFILFSKNVFENLDAIKGADVVIPTNGSVQTFLCRLLTWVFGKPLIVFGHSGPGADDKWNLLCMPNVFVAFSTYQKKWAEKYRLPFTKIKLIYHAVDTDKFKPANRRPRKKIILTVAAAIPDKRVGLVREAVSRLDGYKFVGVGKGNDKEVAFEKINKEYRKADVFCFVPKSHEAFGLVFLEAMASGLPIVTIDDKTRREIVGDAGVFVKNPENTVELATAIKMAYETNWGDKPRKQALNFSWDKVISRYEELFECYRHH